MLLLQKHPHMPLGLWSGHLSTALHVQLPRMLRPRVVRTKGFSDHVKEKIFTQRRNCLGHQYPINFYGLPINFVVKFLTYQNHLSFFIFYLFFCEMNFNAILPLKEFFLLFPIFLCPAERLTHKHRLHFSVSFIIKHLTVALLTINMPSMPTEVSASKTTLHFTSVILHPKCHTRCPQSV